jgi:hypothetical protein
MQMSAICIDLRSSSAFVALFTNSSSTRGSDEQNFVSGNRTMSGHATMIGGKLPRNSSDDCNDAMPQASTKAELAAISEAATILINSHLHQF